MQIAAAPEVRCRCGCLISLMLAHACGSVSCMASRCMRLAADRTHFGALSERYEAGSICIDEGLVFHRDRELAHLDQTHSMTCPACKRATKTGYVPRTQLPLQSNTSRAMLGGGSSSTASVARRQNGRCARSRGGAALPRAMHTKNVLTTVTWTTCGTCAARAGLTNRCKAVHTSPTQKKQSRQATSGHRSKHLKTA